MVRRREGPESLAKKKSFNFFLVMKLRVRNGGTTTTVELFSSGPGNALRLRDLRTAITNQVASGLEALRLSLNNRDELSAADDDQTLQDLKIFGGDLVSMPVAAVADVTVC